MSNVNLAQLSDAELEDLRLAKMAEVQVLRGETRQIQEEVNRRKAAIKVARMSEAEKAAIAAVIAPSGIASQAKVGTPGA